MKEDKPGYKFWNSPAVVTEFSDNRPSVYWQSVLTGLSSEEYSKVLDIGCGAGRNSDLLLSMGFVTYSCDLNPAMVLATRTRLVEKFGVDKSNVLQARMSALPYQTGSLDMVLANGVFHNATEELELNEAFDETVRVLRNNGLLLLSMFTADDIDHGSLREDPTAPVYVTREGLKMILHDSDQILGMLKSRNLTPIQEIEKYLSTINTGKRSILRTVLVKG